MQPAFVSERRIPYRSKNVSSKQPRCAIKLSDQTALPNTSELLILRDEINRSSNDRERNDNQKPCTPVCGTRHMLYGVDSEECRVEEHGCVQHNGNDDGLNVE